MRKLNLARPSSHLTSDFSLSLLSLDSCPVTLDTHFARLLVELFVDIDPRSLPRGVRCWHFEQRPQSARLESEVSVLKYTLGPAHSTPIWVFRHHSRNSISQLHPSTRHRQPIESTIAGRESSPTAFCRRERPNLCRPRTTLACLPRAPIAFAFCPSQKRV